MARETKRQQTPKVSWRRKVGVGMSIAGLLAAAGLAADWWRCLPDDVHAHYVGGNQCVDCHSVESDKWHGSHHDLAMAKATPETVLADFDDSHLDHLGVRSTFFRQGERFFVNTEGPDGKLSDFEVKYVFGVEPLQQYMVEFDRPKDMPENELARVQVLRLSWDTENQKWFYLPPPDVDDKLEPDDPLHWTGAAQNWNHMCADCHSTNLQKSFDVASKTYHTTFSDIDVNCEACHGPGSVHLDLAQARSLFWDRKRGYGLAKLKGQSSRVQVETCAPCHSRRRVLCVNASPGEPFHDFYANELLRPATYYPDGQIRDEVYVYGSFAQSKMYHKSIRCTDCHDPHTAKLIHEGNRVCTSCHAHPAGKYDVVSHHHHKEGSAGTQCTACHMPETPFMEVDLRSDHSLRVPRPDLSVELGTPNACAGCHVQADRVAEPARPQLQYYADWLAAGRRGEASVQQELDRVNTWAADRVREWFPSLEQKPHFGQVLNRAWRLDPEVIPDLARLARDSTLPAIVRASAVEQLVQLDVPSKDRDKALRRAIKDLDPQVRAAAVEYAASLDRRSFLELVEPLLEDRSRSVRIAAARALSAVPDGALNRAQQKLRDQSLQEYREGLMLQSDQAGSWLMLGLLEERRGRLEQAAEAYLQGIEVQPSVTGPRSNLATLLERWQNDLAQSVLRQFGRQAGNANVQEEIGRRLEPTLRFGSVQKLRDEELGLLARDAQLAPQGAGVQYRYGLALYLRGEVEQALERLELTTRLEPQRTDFWMALALLQKKMGRVEDAVESMQQLVELRPENEQYRNMLKEMQPR